MINQEMSRKRARARGRTAGETKIKEEHLCPTNLEQVKQLLIRVVTEGRGEGEERGGPSENAVAPPQGKSASTLGDVPSPFIAEADLVSVREALPAIARFCSKPRSESLLVELTLVVHGRHGEVHELRSCSLGIHEVIVTKHKPKKARTKVSSKKHDEEYHQARLSTVMERTCAWCARPTQPNTDAHQHQSEMNIKITRHAADRGQWPTPQQVTIAPQSIDKASSRTFQTPTSQRGWRIVDRNTRAHAHAHTSQRNDARVIGCSAT